MRASKAFLAVACMTALMLFACSNAATSGDDETRTEFRNRPLQGTFNDKSFSFISGYAEKNDTGTYDLRFYNIPSTSATPWDSFAYFGSTHLRLSVNVPARVGYTELFLNLETGENKTVTLHDSVGNYDILAYVGAVEITTIDTIAGTVSGRIAASDGGGNEVNGNFTLQISH